MDEWYLAKREKRVKNCLVEKILQNIRDPNLFDIYGVEINKNGSLNEMVFLDIVDKKDRHKIKVKSWLKQILILETYYKKGDYFSRIWIPTLAVTLLYDETQDLWERVDLAG